MQLGEVFGVLFSIRGKQYEIYKSGLPRTIRDSIESLCRVFEDTPREVKIQIISSVTPEISFLFHRFSDQMASRAANSKNEKFVVRGLESLAIENCTFDW